MVCRLRPAKPRLRINSEDVDGPPSTVMLSNIDSTLNRNDIHERNEFDDKDLNKFHTVDINKDDNVNINENQQNTNGTSKSQINATNPFATAQILEQYDIEFDTSAITSV